MMKKFNSESKVRIYLLMILFFSLLYYLLCIFVKIDFFQAVAFYNVNDTFMDWFNCIIGYRGNPYAGETGTNYPALAVLYFKICRFAIPQEVLDGNVDGLFRCQNAWIIFTLYNGILIWIFGVAVDHKLKLNYWDKMLFLVVCLFSFPVLFAFERGNIINLAFVLTFFFCCFYEDENKVLKELALIALAIAAGIKIYPAIFGLLLLKKRKTKEGIRLIGYGLICFVCPFFLFGGVDAIHSFIRGILSFATNRSTVTGEIADSMVASLTAVPAVSTVTIMPDSYGYNFSFSNICKVFREMSGIYVPDRFIRFLLVLICVMLFIIAFTVKESWKELLCYTLIMILVPSFSGAYVLLFMLIPLVEFLNYQTQNKEQTGNRIFDFFYALLFLLLMSPLALPDVSYFDTNIQPGPLTGSFLCYFICVFLLVLLLIFEGIKALISACIGRQI